MRRAPFDWLGVITVTFAMVSAVLTAGVLWISWEQARMKQGFPPGAFSGAAGFAENIVPLVFSFAASVVGLLAIALLVASCATDKAQRRRMFSFLRITAAVLLLPALLIILWNLLCILRIVFSELF